MSETEPECWRLALASQNAEQRLLAAENLSYLGEEAAFAAVELVEACSDTTDTRDWVVAALESLGTPPVDSKRRLSELCFSTDPLVAYWAITLLGRLGADAVEAQDQLIEILENGSADLSVLERAVWALGKMGAEASRAIPALGRLQDSDRPRLANLAVQSISQIES